MLTQRQLFLQYLAQTNNNPLALEIDKAKGIYLYDKEGKPYIDLISGISVSNLGHSHPAIIKSIKEQVNNYSHLMVYGEYIQSPQIDLAKLLIEQLPDGLDSIYFVNSGSEAIEGAMKLAKRYTARKEIIAFKNSYHGSTQGALSILGNTHFTDKYQPLLPNIKFIDFNNADELDAITNTTACVVAEAIQGEAGVIIPNKDYLKKIRQRCNETDTLFVLDEVQTGFGRTGSLFAFEQFDVVPDILVLAKALGGSMPLGAFIASNQIMSAIGSSPELGHITTFGGHPICCAAGLAHLQELLKDDLIQHVNNKGWYLSVKCVLPNILRAPWVLP